MRNVVNFVHQITKEKMVLDEKAKVNLDKRAITKHERVEKV